MIRMVWLRVILALALVVLAASSAILAGGGGSNAVYTLDPVSWSIINNSAVPYLPADIFVDDGRRINPGALPPLAFLTQDLTAAGLGLPATADIRALSSGNDDVIGFWRTDTIPDQIAFQFGVERLTIDDVQQEIRLPFGVWLVVDRDVDFAQQFTSGDQAADVFQNVGFPWAFGLDRWNFFPVNQNWFALAGNPPLPAGSIDDMDDFTSMFMFGVNSLDEDGDGFNDVPVYISLDPQTAQGLLGSPGDIWVVPEGGGPPQPYATAAQLGLQAEDEIDCHCVYDENGDFQFDGDDIVLFSLRAGSPSLSLPIVVGGVPIGAGGAILAIPTDPRFNALPDSFFSLAYGSDLDAIHCFDPRSDEPELILPFEALYWLPTLTLYASPDTSTDQIDLVLSNAERADTGGVTEYSVSFSLTEPGVARIQLIWVLPPFVPTGGAISPDGQSAEVQAWASYPVPPESADVRLLSAVIASIDTGHTELQVDSAEVSGIAGPLELASFKGAIVVRPLGDCNWDGLVDLGDVVFMLNYLFRSGPAPDPLWLGDVNCDEVVDIGDVVCLLNYLFKGEDLPCC